MKESAKTAIMMVCAIITTALAVWQRIENVEPNIVTYISVFVAGFIFGYLVHRFAATRQTKKAEAARAAEAADARKKALENIILMLTPTQMEMVWTLMSSKDGRLLLRGTNADAIALRRYGIIFILDEAGYVPPDKYFHMLDPEIRVALMKDREAVATAYEEATGKSIEDSPKYRDPGI